MKTFSYQPTSNKDLFRVVDREGNWQYYVLKPNTPEQQFLRGVTSILGAGFAKGPRFYEYLKNGTREQLERTLQTAGERGDRLHQFFARILSAEKLDRFPKVLDDRGNQVELSNDEWDAVLSWEQFWLRHDCALVAHEFAVYHARGGDFYAGTVDAVVRLRKDCGVTTCGCEDLIGKVGLVDWKTGGGIYPDYAAQVAAYANAQNIQEVIGSRRIEYTGIVRLGTRHKKTGGYELETWDQQKTADNLVDFNAASVIAEKHLPPFDPEKDILEIPDALSLKIVRDVLPKPKKSPKKPAKGKGRKLKTAQRNEQ